MDNSDELRALADLLAGFEARAEPFDVLDVEAAIRALGRE